MRCSRDDFNAVLVVNALACREDRDGEIGLDASKRAPSPGELWVEDVVVVTTYLRAERVDDNGVDTHDVSAVCDRVGTVAIV